MTSPGPIRYLSAADVDACLPSLDAQLDLAARALTALEAGTAEMPSKIGVHPRPGALLHAMPAWLRDGDLVGLKWVSAFGGNTRRGIPAINGLIVLNDAGTGLPTVVMDAARITAVRTAAVSGVALRLFLPRGASRAGVIGAGVQAWSHLPHLANAMPGGSLIVFDRHPERAHALADAAVTAGFAGATVAEDARSAAADVDMVVTLGALGSQSQVMTAEWIRPGTLVIAVDFATHVAASLAGGAARFVVDDGAQFLAYRNAGSFDGYPDPTTTLGAAVAAGTRPPIDGRTTVVSHLGVGLADVLFADAVRAVAASRGLGMELPR
jgi:alanine dehydrogenase